MPARTSRRRESRLRSIPESRGRVVQVAIQLHFKVDASNPAFAGVPQNALNLYQKAVAASQKGDSKAAIQFLLTP
jgi:hypothetical protein